MPVILYKQFDHYIDRTARSELVPVYLIHGEEFLCRQALQQLTKKITPDEKDRFNQEIYDGENEDILEAMEKLNTFSLLAGPKVVILRDSKVFYARQNEQLFIEKAKEAYEAENHKKAAQFLLNFLGKANLSLDDLHPSKRTPAIEEILQWPDNEKWLNDLWDYCHTQNLQPKESKDQTEMLQNAVINGFPVNHHLIIQTDMVDKRRVLYKTINEHGIIIDCSVPKGDSFANRQEQEALLRERMQIILQDAGKTMDSQVFQLLYEMTGFDLRSFSGNLEKVIQFVGDRKRIVSDDIQQVIHRTKSDPIYRFTEALGQRSLPDALFFVHSLLQNDFHPLQILSAAINAIRKLLLIKSFVQTNSQGVWQKNLTYNQFKSMVMPVVKDYDQKIREAFISRQKTGHPIPPSKTETFSETAKSPKTRASKKTDISSDCLITGNLNNPYPIYQLFSKSDNFSLNELIGALSACGDADITLKTTSQKPRLVLERLIFSICKL